MGMNDEPRYQESPQSAPATGIFEVRAYVDAAGRRIEALFPLDGSAPSYHGNAAGRVSVPGRGITQVSFKFEIKASGIEEAFAVMDKSAEATWPSVRADMLKNAEKSQHPEIIVPNPAASKKILGGSGRQ